MFRFVFFAFFLIFLNDVQAKVIPFTVGDLQTYKSLDSGEKLSYLMDFYKKNKAIGATDGEIINEIVKIDEIQNDSAFQTFSKFSSKIKSVQGYINTALHDINQDIASRNPGRDDLLINPDDSSTWKNIQYVAVGDKSIKDYIDSYSKDKFFSEPVYTDDGAVLLASCARTGGKTEVLMGYMLLMKDGVSVLYQKEGEAPIVPSLDFSNSENVAVGNAVYPLRQSLPDAGGLGYVKEVVLPFSVTIKNPAKPAVIRAELTANVCRNGDCAVKTFPQAEYTIFLSLLESSICTELEQKRYNAPANRHAGIRIKGVAFQREKDAANLIVRVETPFSFAGQPELQIANTEGLLFDSPFVGKDNGVFFYRVRLKNPEQLKGKKEVALTLTFYNAVKADEFSVKVKTKNKFLNSTATTFSGCVDAFFSGISFILLTPLFSALLLLVYALIAAPNRSVRRADFFFDGLAEGGKIVAAFYAVLLLAGAGLPKSFFWGVQFESPWLNFMYAALFAAAAIVLPKLFDDDFVNRISFLKAGEPPLKAGFLTAIVCGGLLLFTPEIKRFYDVYTLLSRSPVLYTGLFLLAIMMPFAIVALLDRLAGKELPPIKGMRLFIVFPLLAQVILLLFLTGLEIGLWRGIGAVVLLGAATAAMFRFNRKKVSAVCVVISLLVVPLLPNEYDFNALGAQSFDEQVLKKAVEDGKSVYLNVTESGCLVCQINRLMMMYKGGRKEIKQGKLIVMGVPYAHPFARRMLNGTGQDRLPANLIFSPKSPSGKILPSVIGPWLAPDIVRENVQPLSKSTN